MYINEVKLEKELSIATKSKDLINRSVTGNGVIINGEEYNCSHCTYCDNEGRCVVYNHNPIWYTGCSGINIGTHQELFKNNFFYTSDLKDIK